MVPALLCEEGFFFGIVECGRENTFFSIRGGICAQICRGAGCWVWNPIIFPADFCFCLYLFLVLKIVQGGGGDSGEKAV